MTRRRLRPLAALAALALIGCSDAPSERREGSTATAPTEQDKAVKFAECIRAHGVPDFPDANADGEFVFGINVSPAVWTKAVDACKALQPPGSLSAERTPEQQSASLRFARCMRENGVKDFPDPVNGEPLIDTTKIPSSNREGGMSILNAAVETCRSSRDEAVGGR